MAGFELDFIAVDQATPAIQNLSKELEGASKKTGKFASDITKASTNAESGLKRIPGAASSASASLGTLQAATGQLFSALTGLTGAAGILIGLKNAVNAAAEEEESLRKLSFAVEANSESWEANKEAVNAFATEQQRLTRFSDTETFEAMGKLVRAGATLSESMDGVRIAFGLAEQSGKDVNFILDQLAFLIAGETRSLFTLQREFGSFMGNATTAQGVLENLGKAFRGSAEKSQSFEKTVAGVKNELGDFMEDIGRGVTFLIGGGGLVDAVIKTLDFIRKMGTALAGVAAIGVESFSTLGRVIQEALRGNFGSITRIVEEGQRSLEIILTENARQIEEIDRRRVDNTAKFENRIQELKAGTSKQEVRNVEKAAQDRVEAERRAHETLRQLQLEKLELDNQQLEASKLKIEDEKNARLQALEELRAQNLISQEEYLAGQENVKTISILKAEEAKEGVKKNFSEVDQAAKQMADHAAGSFSDAVADMILEGKSLEESLKAVFNSVIRDLIRVAVQAAITNQAMGGISPAAGGLLIGAAVGGSMIKNFFAEGGVVTKPTVGMVGEAGPEAIIPLNQAGLFSPVNVNLAVTNHNTFNTPSLGTDQVKEIMNRISSATRNGSAEGAEMVKSILARSNKLERVSV